MALPPRPLQRGEAGAVFEPLKRTIRLRGCGRRQCGRGAATTFLFGPHARTRAVLAVRSRRQLSAPGSRRTAAAGGIGYHGSSVAAVVGGEERGREVRRHVPPRRLKRLRWHPEMSSPGLKRFMPDLHFRRGSELALWQGTQPKIRFRSQGLDPGRAPAGGIAPGRFATGFNHPMMNTIRPPPENRSRKTGRGGDEPWRTTNSSAASERTAATEDLGVAPRPNGPALAGQGCCSTSRGADPEARRGAWSACGR